MLEVRKNMVIKKKFQNLNKAKIFALKLSEISPKSCLDIFDSLGDIVFQAKGGKSIKEIRQEQRQHKEVTFYSKNCTDKLSISLSPCEYDESCKGEKRSFSQIVWIDEFYEDVATIDKNALMEAWFLAGSPSKWQYPE